MVRSSDFFLLLSNYFDCSCVLISHEQNILPMLDTPMRSPLPEKSNMTHVDPNKNLQKRRKANANVDERQNVYWDNQGKYQEHYDALLDDLPEVGNGTTRASEIFRAATKLYYDFYNNGMVNNTSGASNFLLFAGVFPSQEDDDFLLIHPYTTGAKIFVNDEVDVRLAMERLMDRTIEFVLGNAELNAMHNDMSYLEFTQKCEVNHINRCMIRNFIARKMKEEEEEAAAAQAAQVPAEAAQAPAVLVEDGEKEGTNLTKAQDCSKMKQKKKKSKDKIKNNDKNKRRVPTAKNIANIVNSGISSIVISKKKK